MHSLVLVVHVSEEVVGFEVGQLQLEQRERLVDLAVELQTHGQVMGQGETAVGGGLAALLDVQADLAVAEDRAIGGVLRPEQRLDRMSLNSSGSGSPRSGSRAPTNSSASRAPTNSSGSRALGSAGSARSAGSAGGAGSAGSAGSAGRLRITASSCRLLHLKRPPCHALLSSAKPQHTAEQRPFLMRAANGNRLFWD